MTKKILIIGPAWVGDMVMAQTLFKLLKQREPDVIIDVLAPAWTFALLGRMPEVSQAIALPFAHGELKLRERYQFGKQLRATHYDEAIVLPNSFKAALIPWFAQIPKRTGWKGEYRYFALTDVRELDKTKFPLMIEQFMALGLPASQSLPTPYPHPAFKIKPDAQQAALKKHGVSLSGRPILAICPGAEFGPSKRWPESHFAVVANEKIKAGWDVWIFGSQKDKPITEKINQLTAQQCVDFSGRTDLAEAIDLLSLTSHVISNDSGLMHIAAALNKPLTAIYGSTSPAFTPPLQDDAVIMKLNLSCQPCFERDCPLKHHRCMRDLLPEQVMTSMQESPS